MLRWEGLRVFEADLERSTRLKKNEDLRTQSTRSPKKGKVTYGELNRAMVRVLVAKHLQFEILSGHHLATADLKHSGHDSVRGIPVHAFDMEVVVHGRAEFGVQIKYYVT